MMVAICITLWPANSCVPILCPLLAKSPDSSRRFTSSCALVIKAFSLSDPDVEDVDAPPIIKDLDLDLEDLSS